MWSPRRFCSFLRHCLQIWCNVSCTVNYKEIISSYTLNFPRPRTRFRTVCMNTMAVTCFDLFWRESPAYINHRIHYQTRFDNNQSALSQTMRTVCQPNLVPKILGTQRDARTRLATALHRRPFSACNKGNRRRLHAGNFSVSKWESGKISCFVDCNQQGAG